MTASERQLGAMVELRESVAAVTGASRGIGRAIAEALAAEGARLVLNARTEESLASIAEMQRLALAAKLEAPANLELIAEADRDAHRLAFRKDMNALAMMLLEIEADILDGASAAAMDKIEGSLYQLREDSHQRYRKPRER